MRHLLNIVLLSLLFITAGKVIFGLAALALIPASLMLSCLILVTMEEDQLE